MLSKTFSTDRRNPISARFVHMYVSGLFQNGWKRHSDPILNGFQRNGAGLLLNRRLFITGLASVAIGSAARADAPMFFTQGGVAIRGFDTVAYFRNGAPERGSPDISVMWKAASWHFSSHENREAFEANPRAFAPQFGGYCAYAVGRGYLTETDPSTWRIVEDKLYLVHSPDVARLWLQDIPGNIALAEENWPGVLFH